MDAFEIIVFVLPSLAFLAAAVRVKWMERANARQAREILRQADENELLRETVVEAFGWVTDFDFDPHPWDFYLTHPAAQRLVVGLQIEAAREQEASA